MTANTTTDPFFKSIGDRAEETGNTQRIATANASNNDEELSREDSNNDDGMEKAVQEIESYCVQCEKNGVTRLLLTSIPFFREVIIASFYCKHCGFSNNEIQSAGEIQIRGSIHTVKVLVCSDLDRQLVRSASATVMIPELDLTIPPFKGQLTTIEGILLDTHRDLDAQQIVRQHTAPEAYEKIQRILDRIQSILDQQHEANDTENQTKNKDSSLKEPFTLRIDDPSGNSYVECKDNLNDPCWSKREYPRTAEQNEALGLAAPDASSTKRDEKTLTDDYESVNPDTVYSFSMNCSSCNAAIQTLMREIDIPHFKKMMVMATSCENCGYRDNEVKSTAAISPFAAKITLKVLNQDDLSRDVLKSDTARFSIPEIDLELQRGTLGGRFTTLEGLITQIYEELDSNAFNKGDSTKNENVNSFLSKLKNLTDVEEPFTVILEDSLDNSYIQNFYAPDPDPNMTVEHRKRTFEEDEDLGLNDMNVEGYEGEEEARLARIAADREAEKAKVKKTDEVA